MVRSNSWFTLAALLLLLGACSRTPETKAPPPTEQANSDCVRGEPVPLLEASRSVFRKISALEADETLTGDSPVGVRIHHFGCTAYALEFNLAWKDSAPANLNEAAAGVIAGLPARPESRAALQQIAEAARKLQGSEVRISESETLAVVPQPDAHLLRLRYAVTL